MAVCFKEIPGAAVRDLSSLRMSRASGWLVCACVACLAACDSTPSNPIVGDPTIVGIITQMDTVQSRVRVLVEENPQIQEPSEPGGSKIWFTITERTEIFDMRGPTVARVNAASLQPGLKVEALAEDVILDSYPQQAAADTIVIVL